ncbi:MAG: L-serine ammonia-lyase [Gammaproteobacteria bacterium]|nr:L-serine ammonia-lyase [Gammaproteobacteria bacterium]MBV9619391.1 L-serine ammonia-lyase [Gammaproteobacteria bacterium]
MTLSVFDIFKVGIGPSSSHTMGPMRAAREFALGLKQDGLLAETRAVVVRLYGSLALTGRGHGTDRAVLAGLEGGEPETLDPDSIEPTVQRIRGSGRLRLLGEHEVDFDEPMQLLFMLHERLPRHSNGLRFSALGSGNRLLREQDYYSIGGGFIVRGQEAEAAEARSHAAPPYPFASAEELLALCRAHGLEMYELVLANEYAWASPAEVRARLLHIWEVMQACVARGFRQTGLLPGVLKVRRRAPRLYRQLTESGTVRPLDVMDWVNAFALAVNEENAAGGRVVTAPTNGAAGIVPAVLHYYRRFESGANDEGVVRFLLVAAAIGMLYKRNASISGAEMGCQGEVGVACSMAAAGLVAALQGTNEQIENAAEIGMEHNLGLTCDPVAGLVQIPCIERNAMGAVKAINAARLAMRGDGSHKVSLDQVIATMRQTGADMSTIYKETSQGGLAVNVAEC